MIDVFCSLGCLSVKHFVKHPQCMCLVVPPAPQCGSSSPSACRSNATAATAWIWCERRCSLLHDDSPTTLNQTWIRFHHSGHWETWTKQNRCLGIQQAKWRYGRAKLNSGHACPPLPYHTMRASLRHPKFPLIEAMTCRWDAHVEALAPCRARVKWCCWASVSYRIWSISRETQPSSHVGPRPPPCVGLEDIAARVLADNPFWEGRKRGRWPHQKPATTAILFGMSIYAHEGRR
jgi:hypothetical protein